jgi:tetratricopeptide (TPR) repeat protein
MTYALVVAAALAAGRRGGLILAWVTVFVCLLVLRPFQRFANRLVARRAFVRLYALMTDASFGEAHRLVAELRGVYARSASGIELMRMHEGTLLVLQGRFADARRILESIDRRHIRKPLLPALLNNLAWSLVQTGDGARAVAIVRESMETVAVDAAPEHIDDLRSCQLGTLGAALVVAGEPSEAIDPLEQAYARGGTPHHQCARAFYLGEAFHALGRQDEARGAWERAAAACSTDAFGVRARERLEAPAPPYRS